MKATAFDRSLADYNRVNRGVMRSWALLWRAEVKSFGRSALASMCLKNARRWARAVEASK